MSDEAYNALPYLVRSYVQSSPDRLATMARLHGLASPPVEACRVLELGCAAGGNIIPLAYTLPGSTFVGVDFAAHHIDEARRVSGRLGLSNVEWRHASILDVDATWGTFDYIVAHGVYSWVPPEVRARMLAVCAAHLSPQGVAYISYNTYPGWSVLMAVREALLRRARGIADPRRRAATARNLLEFLAAADGDYTVFAERPVRMAARFFKEKVDALGADADAYLVHELLEEINQPLYFEAFVEAAEAHGLQYLCEAELGDSVLTGFPPAVARALEAATDDPVEQGQYMDLLRDQTFRQTLLCRDGAAFVADIQPQAVFEMWAASRATAHADDASTTTYLHDAVHDLTFATDHPPTGAAFAVLTQQWPRAVAFGDLVAAIGDQGVVVGGDDLYVLAANLVRAASYRKELISLHAFAPPVAPQIDERPRASPVAQLQAMVRRHVTNLYHEQVALGEAEALLLPLLDGTRDRAMLRDMAQTPAMNDGIVDLALERLRRSALLLRREVEPDRAGM